MKLGSWLGLGLAAALAVPAVGCLGAPFTSTSGAGTSSSSGTGGEGGRMGSSVSAASSSSSSSGTGGSSCGPGLSDCSGNCVDLQTTNHRCGSCTTQCPVAVSACHQGKCVCNEASEIVCGNKCLDPSSDAGNCGKCGHACATGASCVGGACQCPGGGLDCSADASASECHNGMFDPLTCGSCSKTCTEQQTCKNGSCVCRAPKTMVGGTCVDARHDPLHCGSGDAACSGGTPICGAPLNGSGSCTTEGICTAAGGVVCNGGCYAPGAMDTDPFNCGTCGKVCDTDEMCSDGQCVQFYVPPTSCQNQACKGGYNCCQYPGIPNDLVCLKGSCPPG